MHTYLSNWIKTVSKFPDDYLVFDLETTGFESDCLIVQIGHCLVVNSTLVDKAAFVLDWTSDPAIDQDWLKEKLISTKDSVENTDGKPNGRHYNFDYALLSKVGLPPYYVLKTYRDMFVELLNNGSKLVGHNVLAFDTVVLENHFHNYLQRPLVFNDDDVVDTGIIEKASQLDKLPWDGESMRSFSNRVRGIRVKGVGWSLSGHCVNKYNLVKKHNLDLAKAHDAGYDCFINHLLLEEYKELARI